jgi:hypothetical protein
MVDPDLGQLLGLLEAVALEKQGIGDEPEEVPRVTHAAVAQVLERLGDRARRGRGGRRKLRVGSGLPAEG